MQAPLLWWLCEAEIGGVMSLSLVKTPVRGTK
jgi:hypothetical protein